MFKIELTENEMDIVYNALQNHLDYLECDTDNNEDKMLLESIFNKLSTVSE